MTPSCHLTGRFFDYLLASNRPHLTGFKHWLFHPGMLFHSRQQWWGDVKPRSTPHEGVDLCWFQDVTGNRQAIDQTVKIPTAFPGLVVKIERDFLGQSIYLGHEIFQEDSRKLYTAFGHTNPQADLAVGLKVVEGEIIATVSVPPVKTTVPPHLHITLALIPTSITAAQLTWEKLGTDPAITLLDPLTVFPTPYTILQPPGN